MNFIAIGIGAAIGAWLRWGLSNLMNAMHPIVPLGTLAANWGGGLIIGVASAFFAHHSGISPQWRLFAITGLLGGLTTFSTFSAEAIMIMQRGEYLWAAAHVLLHVLGALILCFIGFALYRLMTGV